MATAANWPASLLTAPPAAAQTIPISEGDAGTFETVQQMCRLINEGSKDPEVNRLAIRIVRSANVSEFDFAGERRAIFSWFRKNIRFLRDVEGKEVLRSARETLAAGMGDCDCQTIAQLALLKSIGQRTRIVTVATQPQAPDQFSHVFPEVRDERGRWIASDTARKKSRYGVLPRSWFRRYGWDTETCTPVDLDNPQAAAEFNEDDIGALGALGYVRRGAMPAGWGLKGLGVRTTLRTAARAAARGRLSGLGQVDWSGIASAINAGSTGAAQIISASRAAPSTLAISSMAPAAQAAALEAETAGSSGLASFFNSPTFWVLIGLGAVVIVAGRR